MAVNAVRQLINRREALEIELQDKDEQLKRLREGHHIFWSTLQKQCADAIHYQTLEQLERSRKRSAMYRERQRNPFQKRLECSKTSTIDYCKMMRGYGCPYCRGIVGGYLNRKLDIDSRSNFTEWLLQDTSNWSQERIAIYENAKKELEEYFGRVEPLEQWIANLRQELLDIDKQLDAIWNMCDSVLEKSGQYKATIARLNRELTPYDRDRYYND